MTAQSTAEYQRQYRIDNADKIREQKRAYRLANIVAIREQRRAYRAENPGSRKEESRRYYAANRERLKAAQRQRYLADKRKVQNSDQLRKYGITLEQKEAMLAAQGGMCAICKTGSPGKRGWFTDHCHTVGHVRGVLCHNCNAAIGLLRDDPDVLTAAASYLSRGKVAAS